MIILAGLSQGGAGVVAAGDVPGAQKHVVLLNGDLVLPWAEAVLGLQSSSLANDLVWGR